MPFIYFIFCLVALTRTSNTVLNKSGESEHLCLIPDLREKTSSFSLLSMIIVMVLSYMACIILRYMFTLDLLRVFIIMDVGLHLTLKCIKMKMCGWMNGWMDRW